jgi:hypothetical protein
MSENTAVKNKVENTIWFTTFDVPIALGSLVPARNGNDVPNRVKKKYRLNVIFATSV